MFCTRCGAALSQDDSFCSKCGQSATAPVALPTARSPRPLIRLMDKKKIAGVCAGFARYFDCEVTLMRVLWLVIAFGTGIGFVGYVVAWIALPKEYGSLTNRANLRAA